MEGPGFAESLDRLAGGLYSGGDSALGEFGGGGREGRAGRGTEPPSTEYGQPLQLAGEFRDVGVGDSEGRWGRGRNKSEALREKRERS